LKIRLHNYLLIAFDGENGKRYREEIKERAIKRVKKETDRRVGQKNE
jgi:hypothetical protein